MRLALREDLGRRGDITTDAIVGPNARVLGLVVAKEDGVLCGIAVARMVFAELDRAVVFEAKMQDGAAFTPGETIATVVGPAAACLRGERTALNFLQHLSGIATLTRRFVDAAAGRVKILDTRKTTPTMRALEKYAVVTGGGTNHRFGLYDMVLIKDNHIEMAGGIEAAVRAVRARHPRQYVVVEAKTLDEVRSAVGLAVDRIMLDNMGVERIRDAAAIIRAANKRVEIEVSGGVDLDSVRELAACNIDYLSVGALTHSAPAIDIALKMKPIGAGN